MKHFIEEYGGALLAAVGTIVLLGMMPAFAEQVKGSTESVIENQQTIDQVEPDSYLIPFSIDGDTYQYEEGMSWREWLNSSYNTGGFTVYVNPCTGEDMLGKYTVTKIPVSGANNSPTFEESYDDPFAD